MPRRRERRWPRIVLGYGVLLAVVAPATDYVYEAVTPDNRPLVIRLAVALVLAVVLIHIRGRFRGDPLWDPPSAFEDALVRQPEPVKLDPAFVKLRTELANSARSRGYFRDVLGPHLRALAEARGGDGARFDEGLPPATRLRRRRIPWRTLAALIDRIEKLP